MLQTMKTILLPWFLMMIQVCAVDGMDESGELSPKLATDIDQKREVFLTAEKILLNFEAMKKDHNAMLKEVMFNVFIQDTIIQLNRCSFLEKINAAHDRTHTPTTNTDATPTTNLTKTPNIIRIFI
jgi:hypothetical protein